MHQKLVIYLFILNTEQARYQLVKTKDTGI